ncbi:hypothetical protein FUAX_15370 [Fulvitalea axinellae]|uniref:DUF1097 domain-containing protein n=1 Tax=Fulvitalea axinellae TaxID=1182444 RepID=A0AAU9D9Y8_9BACT|nr:hypothetical protein FUAX_15370 [Fulvitalea axinellae]
MSFKKFIIIPIIVASLAFTIQIVDQLLHASVPPLGNSGFGWIAFQSWALYFVAGGTVNGGIKTFLSYLVGIGASIAIMIIGKSAGDGLGFFAFPFAVGLVVVPCMCLERTKWLDFIPAIFVASGAFFAFMNYIPGADYTGAAITETLYALIGIIYGFVTVTLRTAYEKKATSNKEIETEKETLV